MRLKITLVEPIKAKVMVGFIQMYYNLKNAMTSYIQNERKFRVIDTKINKETSSSLNQIRANFSGMTYSVFKYKSLVFGCLNNFYTQEVGNIMDYNGDLSYNHIVDAIEVLSENTIDISQSRISKLSFGFWIETSIKGKDIISKNIKMLDLKGFNRDINNTPNQELKIFKQGPNWLGFFADKKGDDFYQNQLKIELRFNKSDKLKDFEIDNVVDLKDKQKLLLIYYDFLKRLDKLTIVDSFHHSQLTEKDSKKMRVYMNVDEWKNFDKYSKGRKAKSRAKKDFKRIQKKYNLNTLEEEIKTSIDNKFKRLLNN